MKKRIVAILMATLLVALPSTSAFAADDVVSEKGIVLDKTASGQYCDDGGSFSTYATGSFTIPSGCTGKIYVRVNRVSGSEPVTFNVARNGGYYISDTISVGVSHIYRSVPAGTYSYTLIGGSSSLYAYSVLVTD